MLVSTLAAFLTVWSKKIFMCSRYYFDNDTMNDIASLCGMRVNRDVYPIDDSVVMIRSTDGIKLTGIKWGYPGINGSGVIINAKAESVLEKKLFRDGIRRRRAVISARYFYEWN